MTSSYPPKRSTIVACIGAGFSGIATGAKLKTVYNELSFHIYDRQSSTGGAWNANTYPGAACDVPGALYSLSFEQRPDWTSGHPTQAELKAYIDEIADKYELGEKISLQTEVEKACWDDGRKLWVLSCKDLESGEEYTHESKILFSGCGVLVQPKVPELKGIETFRGRALHTARWKEDVVTAGKDVVVIGNGCTAAQLVPAIVDEVKTVTQFVRSKHWIQPPPPIKYNGLSRWILGNVPLVMRLHRFIVFCVAEYSLRFQWMTALAARQRDARMVQLKKYIRRNSPEEYHELLIPDYQIGCKRRIIDPETGSYLTTLSRPNLTLTSSPILSVTPTGIHTAEKDYPADLIVFATGFQTSPHLVPLQIFGRAGLSLVEYWKSKDGISGAYNCIACHGFPNFFMLLGPNTQTGHNSALIAMENALACSLAVISPLLEGYASEVEVKQRAEKLYISRIQEGLKHTVMETGCISWYKSPEGWNTMIYPWSQAYYWYECAFVRWGDWNVKYTRKPPLPRRKIALAVVVIAAAMKVYGAGKLGEMEKWVMWWVVGVVGMVGMVGVLGVLVVLACVLGLN